MIVRQQLLLADIRWMCGIGIGWMCHVSIFLVSKLRIVCLRTRKQEQAKRRRKPKAEQAGYTPRITTVYKISIHERKGEIGSERQIMPRHESMLAPWCAPFSQPPLTATRPRVGRDAEASEVPNVVCCAPTFIFLIFEEEFNHHKNGETCNQTTTNVSR